MKPEEKARERIDELLEKARWKVRDCRELNLTPTHSGQLE
jgi:hypothetical protein